MVIYTSNYWKYTGTRGVLFGRSLQRSILAEFLRRNGVVVEELTQSRTPEEMRMQCVS